MLKAIFLILTFGLLITLDNSSDIELTKDLTIGDGSVDSHPFFSAWAQHIYADENGTIFVADRNQYSVFQFSPEGQLLEQFGRSGQGPGEFEGLTPNVWTNGDFLYTYNNDLFRYSVFNISDNSLAKTVNVDQSTGNDEIVYRPSRLHFDLQRNNIILKNTSPYAGGTGDAERFKKFNVYDEDLNLLEPNIIEVPADEVYVDDRGSSISVSGNLPFARKNIIAQGVGDFGNHLCYGWTEDITIECADMLTGEVLTTVTLDLPEIQTTNQDINTALSSFPESGSFSQRNMRQAIEHNTWPAFDWFTLDDKGNFWIAVNGEDRQRYDLHIVDYQGNEIGKTQFSKAGRIHNIRDGKAYSILEDEHGAIVVVRYQINGM